MRIDGREESRQGGNAMGRGDRKRVRWAHDRERRHKQRDEEKASQRAKDRKAAKK